MDTIKRIPTHPGDVLKEELECRKISQKKFSEVLGVSYTMLNEILNGKRPITSDFALMVEAALDINAELLVNMQTRIREIILINTPKQERQIQRSVYIPSISNRK